MLNSKNERKIRSPFIIERDFESILVPDNNGKQNPEESYTNNYQKHIACIMDVNECVLISLVSLLKHLGKDVVREHFISLKNIEAQHIEIVISILN